MPPKPKPEPPESVLKLANVMPVTWRSMFGGFGIYCEDVLFGIVSSKERELYFRIDAETRPAYEKAASMPFQPRSMVKSRPDAVITMPYWFVPEKVLAKPATLRKGAEKALEAARTAKAARLAKKAKTVKKGPGVPGTRASTRKPPHDYM